MNNILPDMFIKEETITSVDIASMLGKEHCKILKDIRKYIKQLEENNDEYSDFFQKGTYKTKRNREFPCYNVTIKGCDYIGSKLSIKKRTKFKTKYISVFNDQRNNIDTSSLYEKINLLTNENMALKNKIDEIKKELSNLLNGFDLNIHENNSVQAEKQQNEQITNQESNTNKKYNIWFLKMQPKYKLLEEYFGITRKQLYRNILLELENVYKIDTYQIQIDYCNKNNVESCYPLEPYEHIPEYREMIESIVNNNLMKFRIVDDCNNIKHETIFTLPVKKERITCA